MLMRVSFFFDPEEEEAVIDHAALKEWAKEVNDSMAAFVIGYQGWLVEAFEEAGDG